MLAVFIILGGVPPIERSASAGKSVILPSQINGLRLTDNFGLFHINMDNRLKPSQADGELDLGIDSSDGSDNAVLVHKRNYIGGMVSKEKYNMLTDDFEFTGDISMMNGGSPGDRGMAFVFHNDSRGQGAIGSFGPALGIHGGYEVWPVGTRDPISNAIAIEVDPLNSGSVYDYGTSGGHIAIVKPTAHRERVIHEEMNENLKGMLTGHSQEKDPFYAPNNPPKAQTIRVRWRVNPDGTYTLSYDFWMDGSQKDIPGEDKLTGSKTFKKDEVLEMFGQEGQAYFGIYAGADRLSPKWETIKVGYDSLREIRANYYYEKKVLDDEGQYKTEYALAPEEGAGAIKHQENKALNGKRTFMLQTLPSEYYQGFIEPTAEMKEPLSPLKEPQIIKDGNHSNKPSITNWLAHNNQVEVFVVPFKDGATAQERKEVNNYNFGVRPRTTNVKIEYVIEEDGKKIVKDTFEKRDVPLGSEVGATDIRKYEGFKPTGVTDGAEFIGTDKLIAKMVVPFDILDSKKSASAGSPEEAIFQVIYTVDEDAIGDIVEKYRKDHKTILGKEATSVKLDDLGLIEKALSDYEGLVKAAQKELKKEKALLDSMKAALDSEILINNAKELVKRAAASSNEENIKAANEAVAIVSAANDLGNLTPTQVATLDEMKKTMEVADLVKEANDNPTNDNIQKAEKAIEKVADKATNGPALTKQLVKPKADVWKNENKDILSKTPQTVTVEDRKKIESAIESYDKLEDGVKSLLTTEYKLLQDLLLRVKGSLATVDLEAAKKAVAAASENSTEELIKNGQDLYDKANDKSVKDLLNETQKKELEDLARALKGANELKTAMETAKAIKPALNAVEVPEISPNEGSIKQARTELERAKTAINLVEDADNRDALLKQVDEVKAIINAQDFRVKHKEALAFTVDEITGIKDKDERKEVYDKVYNAYWKHGLTEPEKAMLGAEKAHLYNLLKTLEDEDNLVKKKTAEEAVRKMSLDSSMANIENARKALEDFTPEDEDEYSKQLKKDWEKALEVAKLVQPIKDMVKTNLNAEEISEAVGKIKNAKDKSNSLIDPTNKKGLLDQLDIAEFQVTHSLILSTSENDLQVGSNGKITAGEGVDIVEKLNKAMDAFNKLEANIKEKLESEKAKLDELKDKIERLYLEDAREKILVATKDSTSDKLVAAEEAHNKLTDGQRAQDTDMKDAIEAVRAIVGAKDYLTEKNLSKARTALDLVTDRERRSGLEEQFKKLEIKLAVDEFREDHPIAKTGPSGSPSVDEKTQVANAIEAYKGLSSEAKAELSDEKENLDKWLEAIAKDAVKKTAENPTAENIIAAKDAFDELKRNGITPDVDLEATIKAAETVRKALDDKTGENVKAAEDAINKVKDENNKSNLQNALGPSKEALASDAFKRLLDEIKTAAYDSSEEKNTYARGEIEKFIKAGHDQYLKGNEKIQYDSLDAVIKTAESIQKAFEKETRGKLTETDVESARTALEDVQLTSAQDTASLKAGLKDQIDRLKAILDSSNLAKAKEAVADAVKDPTEEKLSKAQEAIGSLTDDQRDANPELKDTLEAIEAVKKVKKALESVPLTDAQAEKVKELIKEAKTAIGKVKDSTNNTLLSNQLGIEEEKLAGEYLKLARTAVEKAAGDSNEENIRGAQAAIKKLTDSQLSSNPDLEKAVKTAENVKSLVENPAPNVTQVAAVEKEAGDVGNETYKDLLLAQIETAKADSEGNKFLEDNKEILSKDNDSVSSKDQTAIDAAIKDYEAIPEDG